MNDVVLNVDEVIKPQVKYRGSVKIFYIDGRTKRARVLKKHNSGGPGLFTAICRMLVGLDSADYVPSYILGFSGAEGGGQYLFSQKISYAATPTLYQIENGLTKVATSAERASIVEYTFMIPATSLIPTSEKILSLVLYNNRNEVCAILDLSSTEAIDPSVGSNILIYWKLKFE